MTGFCLNDAEREELQRLVAWSLREDHAEEDLTSKLSVPADAQGCFVVRNRAWGVLAASEAVVSTLAAVDPSVEVEILVADGTLCVEPTDLVRVQGPLRAVLAGERTFLNLLLGLLGGTATLTRRFVDAVGPSCTVLDTRKTVPAHRLLQKYAVRCGGGSNHRMHLADGILLKDNHRHGSLDLPAMVARARAEAPGVELVVEVDDLAQFEAALALPIDRILLDNFSTDMVRRARTVRDARGSGPGLEVSGGVDLTTAADYASSGAEFVSVGAITHSAPNWDLGLDEWED